MSAFSSSSQGKRWLYGSLDALHQAQMSLHSELSSSSSRATPSESNEELAARLKEESYIIRQFCNYILNGVGPTDEESGEEPSIKRSWKVPATACAYLRRFYFHKSILDYDPRIITPVCIFLASKVQDSYIRADVICQVFRQEVEDIHKFEMTVLEVLTFDVRIFHPEGSLDALVADYHNFLSTKGNEKGNNNHELVDRSNTNLLIEAPARLHHGSMALHKRIQRAKKSLKLLRTTTCSLIASPALIAMAVICQDVTDDGKQFTEFSTYIEERLGKDTMDALESTKHDVIRLLQEVSVEIDEGRVKKAMKKLSKASSWKKKADKDKQ